MAIGGKMQELVVMLQIPKFCESHDDRKNLQP